MPKLILVLLCCLVCVSCTKKQYDAVFEQDSPSTTTKNIELNTEADNQNQQPSDNIVVDDTTPTQNVELSEEIPTETVKEELKEEPEEEPKQEPIISKQIRKILVAESILPGEMKSTEIYTVDRVEPVPLPVTTNHILNEDGVYIITEKSLFGDGDRRADLRIVFGEFGPDEISDSNEMYVPYDRVFDHGSAYFRYLESPWRYAEYLEQRFDVLVGVWDSGFQIDHPHLKNSMWTNSKEIPGNGIDDDENGFVDDYYGYNFSLNQDPTDVYPTRTQHGTQVAGVIAAERNWKQNTVGINPYASILVVKNSETNGIPEIPRQLEFFRKHKPDVLNCSFSTSFSENEREAVRKTLDSGVIIVAGAANDYRRIPDPRYVYAYPARIPGVISVGNWHSGMDRLAFTSNFGEEVDFAVPGTSVYTTTGEDGYKTSSGTSFSSPLLAGLISRMKGYDESENYDSIMAKLIAHSIPVPDIKYGRIDVKKLVESYGWSFETKYIGVRLSDNTDAVFELEIGRNNTGPRQARLLYIYTNKAKYSVHKRLF